MVKSWNLVDMGTWAKIEIPAQGEDGTTLVCSFNSSMWNSDLNTDFKKRITVYAKLIEAAPELLIALEALFSNEHIDLGDLVYNVRESEGEGWEVPSVTAWGEAVTKAKEAIQKATSF